MRVLLDEQLDWRLRNDFSARFLVTTVERRGWKGVKNGILLKMAAAEFDAFVTMDKGIEHEQNWAFLGLAVILVIARTNRYSDTKPLIPAIEDALDRISPGRLIRIRGS
jgi:predicted nuclease of predicted toxin-antitoxin system